MWRRALLALSLVGLVAGCGGESKRTVSLDLPGAASNENATACAKTEAFFRYPAPGAIAYSGAVRPAPSGRWKVKVKVKRCSGGRFVDATSQKIVGQASGRFEGTLPIGERGAYSMRAKLSNGGTGASPKVYLKIG